MNIIWMWLVALMSLLFIGSGFWVLWNQSWRTWKSWPLLTLLVSALSLTLLGIFSTDLHNSSNQIQSARLKTVQNQDQLETLLENTAQKEGPTLWFGGTGNPNVDSESSNPMPSRDVIGTNTQVEGIEEGDIVKTDVTGNRIFYAPYYSNRIVVLDVSPSTNLVSIYRVIDLGDIYAQALYTDDHYLIVIGYRYDLNDDGNYCGRTEDQDIVADCFQSIGYQETGTVVFIDLETFTLVYTLESDFAFMDHRYLEDVLYLVGNRYVYQTMDEYRPQFVTSNGQEDHVDVLPFSEIYYFEDMPVYSMTVLVGIKIRPIPSAITYQSEAYLGSHLNYKGLYVSSNAMYLSQSVYHYTGNESYSTMFISQFDLNIEEAYWEYRASVEIVGHALNQFSMDEYEGYLRVATTDVRSTYAETGLFDVAIEWSQTVTNYLYILQVNNEEGFDLIGLIDEGLGKPNESIRSVRFHGDTGYIVTFFNTDPLYIIDLSDPAQPTVLDDIELPGFDTYQHPWGENHLIGLGFAADENGQITGMKLTAYDTTVGGAAEIETYEFNREFEEERENYTYFYSFSFGEALFNHKALMVSPEHGLIGFGITSSVYGYSISDSSSLEDERGETIENYYYAYRSYYAIFKIDFSSEDVIQDPIMIEHPESEMYYVTVDRGVYIDGVVHTLSNQRVISYDLATDQIISDLVLYSPLDLS